MGENMKTLSIQEIEAVSGALTCVLSNNATNWASVAAWGIAGAATGGLAGAIVGAGADYIGQSWTCTF